METVHLLIVGYLSIVEGDSICGNTIRMPNKCIIISSEVRSWNESNNFCLSQRASLVMPKQLRDHKPIEKALKVSIPSRPHENPFSKLTGTWTSQTTHTENSVDYKFNRGRIGWNDESCEELCYFICEKKECPQHCEKKETPKLRKCSNGASKQGRTCFFHNSTLSKNWNDARKYCFTKGARLTKLGTPFWTAGQRKGWDTFVYADWNETVPNLSSDWSLGEPNNAGGREDCIAGVFRENIKMNDDNCLARLQFICTADECPEDCADEKGTTIGPLSTTVKSAATDTYFTDTTTAPIEFQNQRTGDGAGKVMYNCTSIDQKLRWKATKLSSHKHADSKGTTFHSSLLLCITANLILVNIGWASSLCHPFG